MWTFFGDLRKDLVGASLSIDEDADKDGQQSSEERENADEKKNRFANEEIGHCERYCEVVRGGVERERVVLRNYHQGDHILRLPATETAKQVDVART